MARRYKIWDKVEDIHTLGRDENGKAQWTAAEYIQAHAPWANNPNVKVVVGGGAINGTVFMEFSSMVDHYRRMGAEIEDGMTDDEILEAIEDHEDKPSPTPE
jgi:hypothetical protein